MSDRSPNHTQSWRPMTDRWTFKPIALALLVVVVIASSAVLAVVISPPFLAAGMAVREVQHRLDEAGSDFTRIPRLPSRSTIYARDGKTVLAHVYLDNREIVPLHRISPVAVKAVLAIEDSEFYRHGAINLTSLARAVIENVRAGEVVQGGSTITQQLVKQTLLTSDQSLARKFEELALAQRVEQQYSKDQILELYMNNVFLGNNVYGIGTAARFYFHKPASALTLPEAALLAGLIRGPTEYDPIAHKHAAYLRRNDVLNRMIALGKDNGGVNARAGVRAKDAPLGLAENVGQTGVRTPPFLVSFMRQQIHDDPNGWYSVLGKTPEDRDRAMSEGGLKIVTTLDPGWQRAAQKAASKPWARTPLHPDVRPEPDLAIVSLQTDSGAIRTMLSGRDYQKDQINTVTTQHQPGSSFKPYILAAAFEQGIAPTDRFSGAQGPIEGCNNQDGSVWNVTNAEGTSLGSLDLYHATAESVNAVFARLIVATGPDNVVNVAQRAGITTPLLPVCALATGSIGITPLDQAAGFATLANSGIHCTPYAVQEIRRRNRVLFEQTPDCVRAIPGPIANLVTELLKGPVTYGTASSVFSSGWGPWPLRGKTGTADLNKELWFAGYTRQVATAVWVGSPQTPYEMPNYWGYSVFGGSIAAPIWKDYMLHVMEGMRPREFPTADLVSVPSVIGKPVADAIQIMKDAGFKVTTEIIDSYLPNGTVAEQSPAPHGQTIQGITVHLSVSNGNAPHVTLPAVKGLTQAKAEAALAAIHVTANVVVRSTNDPALDGLVYGMNPDAGTSVLEGSSATLFVWAKEKPSPSPSPSPSGGGNGNNGNNGNGNGGHARVLMRN
jgi:membrane peptidoglycan carboxypeptidase